MKTIRVSAFTAAALLATLAATSSGQWLETTIHLPDSMNNLTNPDCGSYNSLRNTVYIASYISDNVVVVIDGSTNTKVAYVNVPRPVDAMCYSESRDRTYCALGVIDSIAVVDGASNEVLSVVPTGDYPRQMLYNPISDKFYAMCGYSEDVWIHSGASNAALAQVYFGVDPSYPPAFNPNENKIYCTAVQTDSVTIIDGEGDTAICRRRLGNAIRQACYSTVSHKAYIVGSAVNVLYVLDGLTDSIIGTVGVGSSPRRVCYNSHDNKVYVNSSVYDDLTVVDCTTDSVVATVRVGVDPVALMYNPTNNKVYCANDGENSVSVIDGTTNRVVTTIGVGTRPRAMVWNPMQNRTYVLCYASGDVSVIRDVDGIQELAMTRGSLAAAQPTFVRGILTLRGENPALLLDAMGRRAADLMPGQNNVGRLPAGVYFIVAETGAHPTRVVLTK